MTAAAAAVDAFNDMDQVAAQMEAAMDGGGSSGGDSVAGEGCTEKKKIDLVPGVRGSNKNHIADKLSPGVESVDNKSSVEEDELEAAESSDSGSPPASVEFDRSTEEDASNLSAPSNLSGWTKEMKNEESILTSKKKAAEEDADDGQSLTKADGGGISVKSDRADSKGDTIEETTKLASILISATENEAREQEPAVTPNDAIAVAQIQPKFIAALVKSKKPEGELPARIHEPAGSSSKNQVGFKGLTSAVSSRILRKKKTKGSASAPDKRASSNAPPKCPSSNTSRKDKLRNLRRVRVLGNMQSKLQAKRGVKSKSKPLNADTVPGSTKMTPTTEKGESDLLRLAAIGTPQTAATRVEDSPPSSGDVGYDSSTAVGELGTPCISTNDLSELINETCPPIPPAIPASSPINESAGNTSIDSHGDIESEDDDSCVKTVACVQDSNEDEDIADSEPDAINETAGNEEDKGGTVRVAFAQNGPETLKNEPPDDDGDSLNMLCATDSHGIIGNSKGAVVVEVSSFDSSGKDSADRIEVIKCIGLDEVAAAMNEEAGMDELREGEVRKASESQQESSKISCQSKRSGPSTESSKKSGASESTNCTSNRNDRSKIRETAKNMMKNEVVLSQGGRQRSRSKSQNTRGDAKSRMPFRKKKTVESDKPDSSSDKTPSKGLSAGAKEALRAEEAAREEIRAQEEGRMAPIVQIEITGNNETSQPTGLSDEAKRIISGDTPIPSGPRDFGLSAAAKRTIAGDQHADLDDDMIEVSYDPMKKRNLILKKKKRNGHSSAPKWTQNSKYYTSRSFSSSDTSRTDSRLTRGSDSSFSCYQEHGRKNINRGRRYDNYSYDDDDFTHDESANSLVSSLYGSSSLVSDTTDGLNFKPCGISQEEVFEDLLDAFNDTKNNWFSGWLNVPDDVLASEVRSPRSRRGAHHRGGYSSRRRSHSASRRTSRRSSSQGRNSRRHQGRNRRTYVV